MISVLRLVARGSRIATIIPREQQRSQPAPLVLRYFAASANVIAAKKKKAEANKKIQEQEAAAAAALPSAADRDGGAGSSSSGSGRSSSSSSSSSSNSSSSSAAKAKGVAKLSKADAEAKEATALLYAKDSKRHTARVLRGELTDVLKTPLNINDAVEKLRELAWAKFDETVELSVNLNLDPRKPSQSVKGVARLPHGAGKVVRVAVFASGDDAAAAKAAGADIVGSEDLVTKIQGGDLSFDTIIATPEMMVQVSKIGRILGPRGLMPNPKMGTVTKDVAQAVKAAKAGAVQFRVEKKGIVQAGVGKLSFSNEALLENIRAFMIAVADVRPEGLKGQYFNAVHLSSTMNAGLSVQLPSCDPNSMKFMKTEAELKT